MINSFIKKPYLPQNAVKYVLLGDKYENLLAEPLRKQGVDTIVIPRSKLLKEALSISHSIANKLSDLPNFSLLALTNFPKLFYCIFSIMEYNIFYFIEKYQQIILRKYING